MATGVKMLSEADTCRTLVTKQLYTAGWTDDQIAEQKTFTDGRIVVAGRQVLRRPQKRADYLLRYRRDFAIAIVEAKASYKKPADGLQQAMDYALILGLSFAYATNGRSIIEHDFLTGRERALDAFPSPDQIWQRLRRAEGIAPEVAERLLAPAYHLTGKAPRYYQEIAINRAGEHAIRGLPPF